MTRYVESYELREGWRDLMHPWERLAWARRYWAYQHDLPGTAEFAAGRLEWKGGTYRAYERPPTSSKHTPIGHQDAIKFGRTFKVNWVWLLLGHGTPFDEPQTEAQTRVVRLMSDFEEKDQEIIANMIEAYKASQPRRTA